SGVFEELFEVAEKVVAEIREHDRGVLEAVRRGDERALCIERRRTERLSPVEREHVDQHHRWMLVVDRSTNDGLGVGSDGLVGAELCGAAEEQDREREKSDVCA